ncbi:MAG: glycosyltransferase [Rhizobiales bacterium]|nr:glycosyltransferase [Hyphomicrobiales bacterium]
MTWGKRLCDLRSAGFLSPSEMQRAVVTVGTSRVSVIYPRLLGEYLDALVVKSEDDAVVVADSRSWVTLADDVTPGRFCVMASNGRGASALDVGDALAAFWEHVTYLLIDQLTDAIALHAAAVRYGDNLVLLPGPSGAGKTQLALWYRARGFALATDELVSIAAMHDGAGRLCVGMLARPFFLKSTFRSAELLPASGSKIRQVSAGGKMLLIDEMSPRPAQPLVNGFIVFPRYQAGASLQMSALTPARAGLQLLGQCVNVRNLPGGGLALAAAAARRLPAISLRYGDTEQLDGALDVLTRQILAAVPSTDDLAALCGGFNARAAASRTLDVNDAPSAQGPTVPSRHQPASKRRLTVGMATYDEYDGVYFTVQSIRLHHPELAGAIEFIVVDNNPGGPCSEALKSLGDWIDGYRYIAVGERQGTAVRDAVFEHASCDIVLCMDPHVLIVPGALSRLIDYFQATPDSRDLVQGPLLYDDLRSISTHFEPQWRAGMYGTWASDPRGSDPNSPPFDIPMQGLGLFACRREAWLGFNRSFRGFGGEEGYIHEKFRRRGGRTLCLPFLRWLHRFARPLGPPYVNRWEDRIRNYFIGLTELGFETTEMEAHFAEVLGADVVKPILANIRATMPTHVPAPAGNAIRSDVIRPSEEVYSPHNFSFGDQWATINFYLNMSVMKRQRIRLASVLNGVSLHRLHKEILDVLDSPGEIELTLAEPTVGVDGYNVWNAPYFPTKNRWDASRRHKYVCMQFDGQSFGQVKNPTLEEERLIRRFLQDRCHGLAPMILGKHLSVQECVDIATDSALFVGVDSGMSHLCHSVGVPIFLLEYSLPTVTAHNGKTHILCKGYDDFASRFDRYVNYLHAAGLPDALDIGKPGQELAAAPTPSVLPAGAIGQAQNKSFCRSLAARDIPTATDVCCGQHAIRQVLSLFTPRAVVGHSKARIGGECDGGYVMIDDLQDVQVCYSFGIGFDVSWDVDMAQRGATVFQYDHTVAAPRQPHAAFCFRQIGIAPADGDNMRTLQSLLNENKHSSDKEMILKIDVEGAEWDVFDHAPSHVLGHFKQIVCEFHGLAELRDRRWCERATRVLVKLANTHAPVHVHGNNFGSFNIVDGVPVPDVLEVTYVRRSSYSLEPSAESFPTVLDRPNNPSASDVYLGRFAF